MNELTEQDELKINDASSKSIVERCVINFCLFGHHSWVDLPSYMLQQRKCKNCGKRQKYLTGVGSLSKGWIDL